MLGGLAIEVPGTAILAGIAAAAVFLPPVRVRIRLCVHELLIISVVAKVEEPLVGVLQIVVKVRILVLEPLDVCLVEFQAFRARRRLLVRAVRAVRTVARIRWFALVFIPKEIGGQQLVQSQLGDVDGSFWFLRMHSLSGRTATHGIVLPPT